MMLSCEIATTPELIQTFPSIETLDFQPGENHFEFCQKFGVGVTLLHSHDGFYELCFFDRMQQSRPATAEDKSQGVPMSFYVEDAKLVPYEWTLEPDMLRELPSSLAHSFDVQQKGICSVLVDELCKLSSTTGLNLGLTLAHIEEKGIELEVEGRPGFHTYHLDGSLVTTNAVGVVTCVDAIVDLSNPDMKGVKPRMGTCIRKCFRSWNGRKVVHGSSHY